MARRIGTSGNDTLTGTAFDDEIFGLAGSDLLSGLGGSDEIFGGGGNDTINGGDGDDEMFGDAGNDIIRGGNGSDDLTGGAGTDRLFGGAGDDQFMGGAGKDFMTGGTGVSEYVYNSITESTVGAGRDVITDFKHLVDDIDLRAIDARIGSAVDDSFNFIGDTGFTGAAGQLNYFQVDLAGTTTDKTIIQGDIDGDGAADFQIELTGLVSLSSEDFNL